MARWICAISLLSTSCRGTGDWRENAQPLAVEAARDALARAREEINGGATTPATCRAALRELEAARAPGLRRALNATGVIVHTNLGRAPLPEAALARALEVGRGYSNLEYDLADGARGSRQDHVAAILRRLTGAEARARRQQQRRRRPARARRAGRGARGARLPRRADRDRRRLPDPGRARALRRAAASRSGTTNRTRAADYERAIGPETARAPARPPVELPRRRLHRAAVGRRARARSRGAHGLPLVDDLGSGVLVAARGRAVGAESLAAGADLVCFSGDKLLGGPQAGIVVGRADLVERLRRHPLQRALRADKLTLAALEGTLALYLDPERALREVPGAAHAATSRVDAVRARAERLAAAVGGEVEETVGARRRRRAAARRAPELRLRGRGGARGAAARRRAAGGRRRPRRPAPARLPHAGRRRGRRGRRRVAAARA